LIELDLDAGQPRLIGIGRCGVLVQALFLGNQIPDVIEHRAIGRLVLGGNAFIYHVQSLPRPRIDGP
jgi:hypothetical protein